MDHEEISKLNDALETDGGIMQHAYFVNDGRGRRSKLCIWKHPGHDITGMVARSEKVAGTMEQVYRQPLHEMYCIISCGHCSCWVAKCIIITPN